MKELRELRGAFQALFRAVYEYENAVGYETLMKCGINRAHVYVAR